VQKRCIDDSYKKANLYFKKMNQVEESVKCLKEKNMKLFLNEKENKGMSQFQANRILELES